MSNRLFIGIFPGGISYADRHREKDGDYARLAFLPYDTLQLKVEPDCPADLRVRIEADAASIQARRGGLFQVSSSGQTVMLGSHTRTTQAELERVLQGQDPIANAIIGHLLAQGWSGDDILKNVAEKEFSPNRALVRVEFDSGNQQYWVTGEYVSKGENVLSGCFACIKAAFLPAEIAAAMDGFLTEAETRINQSFAVRFLGSKPKGPSARM